MEAIVLVSLTALVASGFALLVAVGSALRVQRLERGAGVEGGGLSPGTRIDADAFASLVGQQGVDRWLRGPTLAVVAKTTCPGCRDLIADMNRRSEELGRLRVLIIERGHGNGGSLRSMAQFDAVWVDDRNDRSKEVFRTNASPHAFLIEQGKVVHQSSGGHAVEHLLHEGRASSSKPARATPL